MTLQRPLGRPLIYYSFMLIMPLLIEGYINLPTRRIRSHVGLRL